MPSLLGSHGSIATRDKQKYINHDSYFLTVDNLSLLQVFKSLISKYGQMAQYLSIWITKMLVINYTEVHVFAYSILCALCCALVQCSSLW